MNRKNEFRERILGTASPLPRSQYLAETWSEIATPVAVPVPVVAINVPIIEDVPIGTRYHDEDFVRGKIENWAGRPAGANHHALITDELIAARVEMRMESRMPTDHTDADVTARTLAALNDRVAWVLICYHTTRLTLHRMARECGVSVGTCHASLSQGHVDFSTRWHDEWHTLSAELRRLAPVIDPSRDAVPVRTLPRDRPAVAPCLITLEAAPVLGYRKTHKLD